MHTEPKDSLILPRKVGDRFLLFVFASVLAGFFVTVRRTAYVPASTG
jgi:hypothetical protein